MTTRLRLTDNLDRTVLDRWGWECRLFGVFVHRIDAPDPGLDLHDHPWWFVTIPLAGRYVEARSDTREASARALRATHHTLEYVGLEARRRTARRGELVPRRRFRPAVMRLDHCHRIVSVPRRTWTLVVHGPKRRPWGFYTPTGWVQSTDYDATRNRPLRETVGPNAS